MARRWLEAAGHGRSGGSSIGGFGGDDGDPVMATCSDAGVWPREWWSGASSRRWRVRMIQLTPPTS